MVRYGPIPGSDPWRTECLTTEEVDESGFVWNLYFMRPFLMFREARLYPISILDCFFNEDCNENPDKKSYDVDLRNSYGECKCWVMFR